MPNLKQPKTEMLHLTLDQKSFTMLKQKSSYSKKSMSEYLLDLALNVQVVSYNIVIHDLTKMISDIDEMTFKASGYYSLVSQRDTLHPEVTLDDGDNMIRLFAKLSEYMDTSYKEMSVQRQERNTTEEQNLIMAVKTAKRSCYRDMEVIVPPQKVYDVKVMMTVTEKDALIKMLENREVFQADVSAYFRNLILSKRYIVLSQETTDLDKMISNIYAATKYCKIFLNMMHRQGYECEDQAKELEPLYQQVVYYEKEIYNVVANDRLLLYEKYDAKIHEDNKQIGDRRKRRKERGQWQ